MAILYYLVIIYYNGTINVVAGRGGANFNHDPFG